ncbi:MAG: hypothetical protein A2041_00085 [Bacteroidetes bacterium GWA2_31_9b]|nr:MAG: hypothetical protein A2041_00085 [Bacteroidetes bacterium GWA2_31_9b]
MYQESEIITLLLSLIVTFFFVFILRKKLLSHKYLWFSIGILLVLFSQISTVIEGFCFNSFFNLMEHSGYVIASICFIFYFKNLSKL